MKTRLMHVDYSMINLPTPTRKRSNSKEGEEQQVSMLIRRKPNGANGFKPLFPARTKNTEFISPESIESKCVQPQTATKLQPPPSLANAKTLKFIRAGNITSQAKNGTNVQRIADHRREKSQGFAGCRSNQLSKIQKNNYSEEKGMNQPQNPQNPQNQQKINLKLQVIRLTKQISSLSQQNTVLRDIISDLQGKLFVQTENTSKMMKNLVKIQKQNASLIQQIQSNKQIYAILRGQLQNRQDQIFKSKNQINQLQQKLSQTNSQQIIYEEFELLENHYKSTIQTLTSSLKSKQIETDLLRRDKQQMACLQKTIELVKTENKSLMHRIAELKSKRAQPPTKRPSSIILRQNHRNTNSKDSLENEEVFELTPEKDSN